MASPRLMRITNLFREGTELVLAEDDGTGVPAVLFIKKLNPFEEQEARLDGQAARSEKLLELRDPESRDMKIARMTVDDDWSTEDLCNFLVNSKLGEMYPLAKADVDADEEWRENLVYIQRMESLMNDGDNVTADDRALYDQTQRDYLSAIRDRLVERQDEYREQLLREHSAEERADLYYDAVKQVQGLDAFNRQRRITEIWYCVRDCVATRGPEGKWVHDSCTHPQLFERSEITRQDRDLMQRIMDTIDGLTATYEEAGNSDAPTSSSDSLEQQSDSEEASTASIQDETLVGAPTT